MNAFKVLTLALVVSMTSGCAYWNSLFTKEVEVVTIEKHISIPIRQRPLEVRPVPEFEVRSFVDGEGTPLLGMTVNHWVDLRLWMADLKRYQDQLHSIISYYEKANKAAEKGVKRSDESNR